MKKPTELEKAKAETAKAEERAEKAEERASEAEEKLKAEERRREILQQANERHAKRSERDRERIVNSKVWHDKIKEIKKEKINYNKVEKLKSKLSENEIVEKLAGGDQTQGSCASLAFAYVANKAGYDVLDFRGGKSRVFFASKKNLRDLFENYIVKFSNKNGFSAAKAALSTLEDGKEYYFFTGRHAAIVRIKDEIIEYLELQSRVAENNGFKTLELTDSFLKRRFGCKRTMSSYGIKFEQSAFLADIDKITNNTEFSKLMGYIQTKESEQQKGFLGGIK